MRCPKCGYNSFDHLDSCKKCGKDLAEFKERYGVKSVLFPGGRKPEMPAEQEGADVAAEAAEVATAAAVAAAGQAAEVAAEPLVEPAGEPASEAEDFGFDFMGDSEEDEEDLAFDELFEESAAEEDLEESLPVPTGSDAEEKKGAGLEVDEFSFDMDDAEVAAEPQVDELEVATLDDDFGFDLGMAGEPDEEKKPAAESATGPVDDLSEEDFELPPADEDEFSFESDEIEFEELVDDDGAKGDPKDPFDLPESPVVAEAPETLETQTDEGDGLAETPNLSLAEDDWVPKTRRRFPSAEALLAEELNEHPATTPEETAGEAADAEQADEDKDVQPEAVAEVATEKVIGNDSAETLSDHSVAVLPSLGRRCWAFCCDLLLLAAVGCSFVAAAEAALAPAEVRWLPTLETLLDLSIPYFLVVFSLFFSYFTLFHFLSGQTPGKMLAKLRVESVVGEPLTFAQAFLRSVGGLLQLLPAGLGYLLILFRPAERSWSDRLAGTRLVALLDDADAV